MRLVKVFWGVRVWSEKVRTQRFEIIWIGSSFKRVYGSCWGGGRRGVWRWSKELWWWGWGWEERVEKEVREGMCLRCLMFVLTDIYFLFVQV